MTAKQPFVGAIVYCLRQEIKDAIKDSLGRIGVASVELPADGKSCRSALDKNPEFLLVIDWNIGRLDVLDILEHCRADHKIDTRPIFALAQETSKELVSTGYEFHISKTHTGEISGDQIKASLLEISKGHLATKPVQDILHMVSQAREQGQWPKATAMLEKAYKGLSDNPRIAVELAEGYVREERWDDAYGVLEPLVSVRPAYGRLLHLAGRCLMKKGDFEGASIVLSRAKITNPMHVGRLVDLGNCLLETFEVDEARENFDEAQKIDPESKEATIGAGKCSLLNGDVNDALELLRDVADNRELASVFNMSAVMTIRNRKFDEAMALYEAASKAVGEDPKLVSRLTFNRGMAYRRVGNNEEALKLFQEALQMDPEYDKAKAHLHQVQEKLGLAPEPSPEVVEEAADEVPVEAPTEAPADATTDATADATEDAPDDALLDDSDESPAGAGGKVGYANDEVFDFDFD